MSAEFGRGGAAVNVVIKSGTNQLHGGVYEFIRNDKVDAVNYFNQGQQPFKRNQFGAFAGAPIIKNKTFIFGDYSGYRLRETDPFISSVPTALERTGDFSEWLSPALPASQQIQLLNPYTGAPIPGNRLDLATKPDGSPLLDTVGMKALNLYPAPNLGSGDGPVFAENYLTTQDRMNDQDAGDLRVDHRFREQDQIFGSYSINDVRSVRPGPLGDLGGSDCCPSVSDSRGQHLGLGYTHMFSPTLVNDLHGGFFRYSVNALPFNYGKNLGNELGIPNANRGDLNSSGLTNIHSGGYTPLGDSEWLPEHVFENIFQVADTLTWIKGKHSLKFGVDFRRQQRNFYQTMAPRGLLILAAPIRATLLRIWQLE